MKPFAEMPEDLLRACRVVAVDVDDTITRHGRLCPATLDACQTIARTGRRLVLVTGRPAGWAQALAVYLPGVTAAIAENGLVAFDPQGRRTELGPPRPGDFAARLRRNADTLARAHGLTPTEDDAFRLFERSFERPSGFDAAVLIDAQRCLEPGFEVLASSIHLHVRRAGFDKADGLFATLAASPAGPVERDRIVFLGDSGNDRPLFAALPRTSVGVRNVERFLPELGPAGPAYITVGEGADGFAELAARLAT
jgi:hydroxymethylpyrimidine pyrophosphatase-like HAD family hydrolase